MSLLTPFQFGIAKELISHGISQSVSIELVKAKADECRRQLDFLPNRKKVTNEAAFLHKAIAEDYAPPAAAPPAEVDMAYRTVPESESQYTDLSGLVREMRERSAMAAAATDRVPCAAEVKAKSAPGLRRIPR